jgi:mannose-6-phosphate isomerase-like protein (cupin superfamily)
MVIFWVKRGDDMSYIIPVPSAPAFSLKGMKGYQFELKDQEHDFYYLDVETGHDVFIKSKKITRFYYILEGNGYFTVENQKYDVEPGMLVEVPPHVEYSYSGKMKIFLVSHPLWFKGNDEVTRKNPDVIGMLAVGSILSKFSFGKR